jgi:membrane protein implicated in regulation of membrane protease activity
MKAGGPNVGRLVAGLLLLLAIFPILFFWVGSCGAAGDECGSAPALGWPAAITISAILLVAGIGCIAAWLTASRRRRRDGSRQTTL